MMQLFVLLSSSTANECKQGFTYHGFHATYPGTDCELLISFCYRCMTGPTPFEVTHIQSYPDPPSADCPKSTDPAWLQDQVLNELLNVTCSIPPCGVSSITMTLQYSNCYRWHHYYVKDDIPYYIQVLEMCEQQKTFCETEFDVCVDYTHHPPSVNIVNTPTSTLYNNNDCPGALICDENQVATYSPYNPKEEEWWEVDFVTPCFFMDNCPMNKPYHEALEDICD